MLTISADEHPLMRRFHKPGDEKRMVIPLHEGKFHTWLSARSDEEARTFLQPFDPDESVTAEETKGGGRIKMKKPSICAWLLQLNRPFDGERVGGYKPKRALTH